MNIEKWTKKSVKNVDKNPQKYLTKETINTLKEKETEIKIDISFPRSPLINNIFGMENGYLLYEQRSGYSSYLFLLDDEYTKVNIQQKYSYGRPINEQNETNESLKGSFKASHFISFVQLTENRIALVDTEDITFISIEENKEKEIKVVQHYHKNKWI